MKTTENQYEKQANDFLTSHGLTFKAVRIGTDCPKFCEDHAHGRDLDKVQTFPRKTHIHGAHHLCTISGPGRKDIHFDFWNSYADEEMLALGTRAYRNGESVLKFGLRQKPQVTAYDLLACITKSDPGTFEDFCSEFGYDTDSRRAEDTYRAVVEEWRKVCKFFTAEEIEQLQEIS